MGEVTEKTGIKAVRDKKSRNLKYKHATVI